MALRGRTLPARPNTVRPACRRCTATRTTAERIDMWYRHEHNGCLRHLLWTGPGAGDPREQVDLAAHPDIVHAQVRHRRLIREHGHGIVHTAYHTAREIWETVIEQGWGRVLRPRPRHAPARLVRTPGLARRHARPGPSRGHLPRGHHAHRPAGLTELAGHSPCPRPRRL